MAAQLRRRTLDRDRVLAAMLRIVDASAMRIGSEVYAEDNDSFGLTTLARRHTRSVARAHYVHPHMLEASRTTRSSDIRTPAGRRRSEFMGEDECGLLAFLQVLLEREFDHRGR